MSAMKQQQLESPAVDLGALLDAGPSAVVTLVAGDTQLAVHRAVLAAGSPVFAAAFTHDTQEASSGCVQIDDIEGQVLRQLVAFLYSGQAPQLPSMAPQLLVAADKYDVPTLRALCEQQLQESLGLHSAAVTAVLAARHSCAQLRDAAVTFIREHASEVMGTGGWEEAVTNYPKEFLEVSRLVAAPLAQTRSPAPLNGRWTQSSLSLTAVAAPPTGFHQLPETAPLDEDAISCFRSMSASEKKRRLIQAADEGAVDELRALLAAGANMRARDGFGCTALHLAASAHEEVVSCLLQAGAPVNTRDRLSQWTPLHLAAANNRPAVVRMLVAAGADLNARDKSGSTPLHCAAKHCGAEAATALLEAGADRAARNYDGLTPLDVAMHDSEQQLVDILSQWES